MADRQRIIQTKKEILVHVNILSNTVHDWTGKEGQFNQLRLSLLNIQKRFEALANITTDPHEADLARDRAYKLSVFYKNVPKSISKDDLETQLYKLFETSVLYMPLAKVNDKLGFGLTSDEMRAA